MRKISNILILSALIVGTWSCSNSGSQSSEGSGDGSVVAESSHPLGQASYSDDVSDANILQIAIGSKDHTTLVAGVQATKIEHVLVNAGPLTVFAPTNDAFGLLPEGTLENLLKEENLPTLANIITNHATPGSFTIEGLKKEASKGRKIYMATGNYVEIVVDGDDVTVGGAKILGTVEASNGIVHVVDKIILPE
ncbi:MAG: fasciclin domain-containing protein [Cytophagales bacterium]|nr:fasciclin domain-containing protein [Cytophagales bacterium]